jgi:hypothetical protein
MAKNSVEWNELSKAEQSMLERISDEYLLVRPETGLVWGWIPRAVEATNVSLAVSADELEVIRSLYKHYLLHIPDDGRVSVHWVGRTFLHEKFIFGEPVHGGPARSG